MSSTSSASISGDAGSKALILLLDDFRSRQNCIGDTTQTMTEPKSPLEGLERQIEELELVLSGFTHHVRQAIVDIRRQQNTLAHIHRLPIEILQNIFLLRASEAFFSRMNDSLAHEENMEYCLSNDYEEGDDRRGPNYRDPNYAIANRLSRVCSHWYNLATTLPKIWSYLDTRFNRKTTEHYLERSKGKPLFVTCSRRVNSHQESKFMKLVMPHLDRWKAFNSYSKNEALLTDLPEGDISFPSLESIMIHTSAGALMEVPSKIYEQSPRLREFHVDWLNFPFQMGSEVLSGLTSLGTLSDFKHRRFTMQDYKLLFASCPHLQTVFITGADESYCPAELSTFSVEAPNLRSLYLYSLDSRVITTLLFSIFPNPAKLPTVKIFGSCDPDVSKQEFMDTSRVGSFMDLACRNMVGLSAKRLGKGYGYNSGLVKVWRKTGGKRDTFVEFTNTTDCLGDIAVSLLSPKATSTFRELRLTTANGSDVARKLALNLSCCPHLDHLIITTTPQLDWGGKVIALMTQLAFSDGGAAHGTVGPELKHLSLKNPGYGHIDAVSKLLNARHESTQSLLMDSTLLHRLEKLDVQYRPKIFRAPNLVKMEMLLAPRGIAFEYVDN